MREKSLHTVCPNGVVATAAENGEGLEIVLGNGNGCAGGHCSGSASVVLGGLVRESSKTVNL